MKKFIFFAIFLVIIILIIFFFRSCERQEDPISYASYRENQMVVVYKQTPTEVDRNEIRRAISNRIDTAQVRIRRCSDCDNYFELWEGEGIHTVINAQGVQGGSGGGGSKGVGEDDIAFYSLNFLNETPVNSDEETRDVIRKYVNANQELPYIRPEGKNIITVAVLDTGIDTLMFRNSNYLWTDTTNNATGCYVNGRYGWNFLENNNNIFDDNDTKHGTLVSRYVIGQVNGNSPNFIKIMNLKTHDRTGYGDLFSSVCAIHYAISKGANIINASWGFYAYDEKPSYMDKLISNRLKEEGILFITAAGNQTQESDSVGRIFFQKKFTQTIPDDSLRNLNLHQFYPALLSQENNSVIVVTTSFEGNTSPTQNHSSNYVDLGVQADTVLPQFMKFRIPFKPDSYISGSSFATAIASGKIGANLPPGEFRPDVDKQLVLEYLSTFPSPYDPVIRKDSNLESKKLVRNGRYAFSQ